MPMGPSLLLRLVCSVVLLGPLLAVTASAQTYPTRPVRFVVPYPPGGTSDLVGRVVAAEMQKRLKQNFVVENRAGAGGLVGTDAVARAEPDGYTVLVAASGPISYLPALAATLPYDVRKDFEPIGNVVTVPNLMVVSAASPIRSLQDLKTRATQNPGRLNFGSAGNGSSGHIAGELFGLLADVRMSHVPYRGSGPALVGLIGGEIEVMFENLPSALVQVRGGKLRGVAVLSAQRSPSAPEFPTTKELGMPDLVIASSTGLLAPAGTPRDVIARLESTLRGIVQDPEVIEKFKGLGADVDYMDGARYRTFMDEEIRRWTVVGRRARIDLR
jgi:tripartite-type tricarboxylate transporter receptor subunit TctC